MLFSTNLLKHYISLDIESKELMSTMTLHACEVEEVIERKLPDLLVIGYVTETTKHPNADTLIICQLDCGSHGTYQICTAAENIKSDIFVPVALPGTYLPAIDLKIGARKMRGEDSNGMICAKVELGIDEDAKLHGIWILDEDFDDLERSDCGTSLTTKYPRLDNIVLDVDNKTINNRPDLTGLLGMAIELKAIFSSLQNGSETLEAGENREVNLSENAKRIITQQNITRILEEHTPTRALELLEYSNSTRQKIRIETKNCDIYSIVQLDNIELKASGFYDRLKLIDSGLQTQNNRVDFGNLFMTKTGQPVHIFDADKLTGTIVVRQAKDGEEFIDLFDKRYTLTASDIVIADDNGVIALAGIIGGKKTAVSDSTKNIVIEIAHFDPVMVRRTSMRVGTRTDSVLRFEKSPSPLVALTSLSMILDSFEHHKKLLGNYDIVGLRSEYSDEVMKLAQSGKTITFDSVECIKLIFGRELQSGDKNMIKNILVKLGFTVDKDRSVRVPRWRGSDDINIPHDLYEEVARIYGYDAIPVLSYSETMQVQNYSPAVFLRRVVEQTLVDRHSADQIETYPRFDDKYLDLLHIDQKNLVQLRNATAPELSYLRPTMLPNLLQAVAKNAKVYDQFTLFDIGQTWDKGATYSRFLQKQEFETTKLGIVLYQKENSDRQTDGLLQVKAMLDDIIRRLDLDGEISYKSTAFDYAHPRKQGTIIYKSENNETVVGSLVQYHPVFLEQLKIEDSTQVVGAELELERLQELREDQISDFQSDAEYYTIQSQLVTRDLSVVIDASQNFGTITDAVKAIDGVTAVDIFDLYQGENLPAGKKSVALSLTILGDGKWTTQQINSVLIKAQQAVEKVGGEVR